jgi:hypothetical protein
MAAEPKMVTPTQLATELAGKDNAEKVAKTFIRPFLRRQYKRDVETHGTSWFLDPSQVKAVKEAWNKRNKPSSEDKA